jgi:hypothetical protein
MKKIILISIVALLVLGCGNPADDGSKGQEQIQEPPKTIDERLIGGRWYFSYGGELPDNLTLNYFEFRTDIFEARVPNGGALPIGIYSAYTENNTVYDADTGKPLLWFEFYDSPDRRFYTDEQWAIVEPKAQNGDMIKWKFIGANGVPLQSSTEKTAIWFDETAYMYQWP